MNVIRGVLSVLRKGKEGIGLHRSYPISISIPLSGCRYMQIQIEILFLTCAETVGEWLLLLGLVTPNFNQTSLSAI